MRRTGTTDMTDVNHLRRSPPLAPRQPESPAQAEARTRRKKQTQQISELLKCISETEHALQAPMSPEKLWAHLGNMQASMLFIRINELVPRLTELREAAPPDLIDYWNSVQEGRHSEMPSPKTGGIERHD
jgi:hypothetical protein